MSRFALPGISISPDGHASALGFTLLEVLIAITVMSVGLLGVSTMLTHTTQQQAVNANRAIATTLAREQLEQMKRAAYVDVTAANYPQENYGTIAGYEQFQRAVVIADDTPLLNTKTITVTVTWRNRAGVSRNTMIKYRASTMNHDTRSLHPTSFRQRDHNAGLTFVELLIALTVSAVLFAGVTQVFISQRRGYVMRQQVAAMQQQARDAMGFLTRELTMAGYDPAACACAGIATATATTLRFTQDLNGDADAGDANEDVTYTLFDDAGEATKISAATAAVGHYWRRKISRVYHLPTRWTMAR